MIDICGGSRSKGSGTFFVHIFYILFRIFFFCLYIWVFHLPLFVTVCSRLSLTRDERKKRRAREKTRKDCIFFNLPRIVINNSDWQNCRVVWDQLVYKRKNSKNWGVFNHMKKPRRAVGTRIFYIRTLVLEIGHFLFKWNLSNNSVKNRMNQEPIRFKNFVSSYEWPNSNLLFSKVKIRFSYHQIRQYFFHKMCNKSNHCFIIMDWKVTETYKWVSHW